MSDAKLFSVKEGVAQEILGSEAPLEKSLQVLIERNMEAMLGIQFLVSEYSTTHGGRIDSLGIDENGCPVIIEYKRSTHENVINQGLFYLDWLLDHKAEFQLLVQSQIGQNIAEKLDWSAPRLLCIAGGFTRYDEHAVKQINRNIELIRYKRFGPELLMFELVNAVTATSSSHATAGGGGVAGGVEHSYKTISQTLAELSGPLKDLYEELRAILMTLGDDVQENTLRFYIAYKRIKNFACIEVRPSKAYLLAFVKIDPDTVDLEAEKGFARDVRQIGHFGTGDLELTLRSPEDLAKAKPYFEASYQNN